MALFWDNSIGRRRYAARDALLQPPLYQRRLLVNNRAILPLPRVYNNACRGVRAVLERTPLPATRTPPRLSKAPRGHRPIGPPPPATIYLLFAIIPPSTVLPTFCDVSTTLTILPAVTASPYGHAIRGVPPGFILPTLFLRASAVTYCDAGPVAAMPPPLRCRLLFIFVDHC